MTAPEIWRCLSALQGDNAAYIENLYWKYLKDPGSLDSHWGDFFSTVLQDKKHISPRNSLSEYDNKARVSNTSVSMDSDASLQENSDIYCNEEVSSGEVANKYPRSLDPQYLGILNLAKDGSKRQSLEDSLRVRMLIRAYRIRGHLAANLDPLGSSEKRYVPDLDPATLGFTEKDWDRPVFLNGELGLQYASLREIVDIMSRIYCGSFAVQYGHVSDSFHVDWLKRRVESDHGFVSFTKEEKITILEDLVKAYEFEKFLHVKYVGTKRFGLDGGEALIPLIWSILRKGSALGVDEVVFGMAHRGRMNVMANVIGKPERAIFNEFQGGSPVPEMMDMPGDVKYHLGTSSDVCINGKNVHLSLSGNPSHLEAVNAVVLGRVKAKQKLRSDLVGSQVLPILIHGDASFAGQGVVAECFCLSGIESHCVGGTIHIIVNNQIGFTTSPNSSRSSLYPSDIGLMVETPVFHVNADDPEAVVRTAKIAIEYRQQFHKDVIIDMVCYRRYGHNEGDDPSYMHPKMYKVISEHNPVVELYSDNLVKENVLSSEDVSEFSLKHRNYLNEEFSGSQDFRVDSPDWLSGGWKGFEDNLSSKQDVVTGIDDPVVQKIGNALCTYPEGFSLHKSLKRRILQQKEMFEGERKFDFSTAEALAFGSLLLEGFPVRLVGQDSVRGTFSQRHAAFVDQVTEALYYPLSNLSEEQPDFQVFNSILSEYAVLGFEYGYSLVDPNSFVLWEAQFGDFANGAQIVIDQFISCGMGKWMRMSGIVMLLPHGYEGQGSEHSSARIERYLQLSAQENWVVANVTTPANYFHILRTQMKSNFRRPLILFTPKSLIRHPKCSSNIADFSADTSFIKVLRDDADLGDDSIDLVPDDEIRKVIICCGKVYYDLLEARAKADERRIYLLRVEQLYPFPGAQIGEVLSRFRYAKIVWCQEEPENQGAWFYIEHRIKIILDSLGIGADSLSFVGRSESFSTATGISIQHKEEVAEILKNALFIS